jgi:hypothetical protein
VAFALPLSDAFLPVEDDAVAFDFAGANIEATLAFGLEPASEDVFAFLSSRNAPD